MPFVQGHLRHESLAVTIRSECAHRAAPLALQVDSALDCRVLTDGAAPLVFLPIVDFAKLIQSAIFAFPRD